MSFIQLSVIWCLLTSVNVECLLNHIRAYWLLPLIISSAELFFPAIPSFQPYNNANFPYTNLLGKRKRCQVLTTNVEMARGRGATPQSAPFTPYSSLLYCVSLQQRRETQSPESEKSTGSTSEIPEDGIMARTVPLSSLIPTLLPTLQYETGTRGHTVGKRGLSSLEATTELILRSGWSS